MSSSAPAAAIPSPNDHGRAPDAAVHFGVRYDDAFRNGRQLGFGDGRRCNRFRFALALIGHKWTHSVSAREAGLAWQGRPSS